MTRKEYIHIAEALRKCEHVCDKCGMDEKCSLHLSAEDCRPCARPQEHHSFVARDNESDIHIADALAADNPRFDRVHFLAVVRGEKELEAAS